MDALDMRLLRAMGTTAFEHGAKAPAALRQARLAENLGTTRQTVEARLGKLEEQGILLGYELYPNLRHLGVDQAVYHFKAPGLDHAARCFDRLDPAAGFAGAYRFLTPDICVNLYWATPDERSERLHRVSALLEGAQPLALYQRNMPPVRNALTPLDWRIVRAMRHDARRLPEEVAHDLDVSPRTVRRRLDRMAKDHAFDVAVRVAIDKFTHPVPLAFLFRLRPDAGKAAVGALIKAYEDRCLMAWVPPASALGDYSMSLFANSVGEIETLRRRGLDVPGVADVTALLYTGAKTDESWLDGAIERKLEATLVA